MPASLQDTDMDLYATKVKSDNPHLLTTFGNMEKAQQLFVSEMEKENSENYFDPFLKVLEQDFSEIFDKFPSSTDQQTIGKFMSKIGLVDTLVSVYKYISTGVYDAFTLRTLAYYDRKNSILTEIRDILCNFSDISPDVQIAIAKPRLMFGFLAKDLQEIGKHEFEETTESSFPFKSAVNIIHNCSRSADVTPAMYTVALQPGGEKTVSIQTCLLPFLKSSDTYVKLITLLSLGYILEDEEIKRLLGADKSLLRFLLDIIRKATSYEDRRHEGLSVEELLDGLSRLAKNDTNKVLIMNIPNAYQTIKGIIKRGVVVSETIAAVRTIWVLLFNADNRIKVKDDIKFVKKLKDLKNSTTTKIAEEASFACFMIEDSDNMKPQSEASLVPSAKEKPKPSKVPPSSSPVAEGLPASPEKHGHVMISYNWSHQPLVLKINDSVNAAGFPTWIDVEDIKGKSFLDAISQGIEDAEVVVICVSEQYGSSNSCRTEAEFAHHKHKIIIPLMMQKRPSDWLPGWLSILLGAKIYYKFWDIELNNQSAFEACMQNVIGALRRNMNPGQPRVPPPLPAPLPDTQTKSSPPTALKQTTPSEETTTTSKPKKSKRSKKINSQIASQLDSWTEDDKDTWLEDNRLHTYTGMKAITCEQLQFLVKISVKAPEFFYRSLKEEVGLKGLEQLMQVSNAIEKLV